METTEEKPREKRGRKKDDLEGNVDKQGRILDRQGKPLRNREKRDNKGMPFHGRSGKENRKATKRLKARIKWFEDEQPKKNAPHEYHRPGSLKK